MLLNAQMMVSILTNFPKAPNVKEEHLCLKLNYLFSLLWHSYENRKSDFAVLVL
jgi:hypothetical protein